MRLIVPLQAVFQGPGGLVLGTILPCALFYALQLLRGKWRASASPDAAPDQNSSRNDQILARNDQTLAGNDQALANAEADAAYISARALAIASVGTWSSYYVGWQEFVRNPYHPVDNPGGCIELGIAENKLSWDLIENWLKNHPQEWPDNGPFCFRHVAGYCEFHGLRAFKNALAIFMGEVMGGRVAFKEEQMVLTSGSSAALDILAFSLAEAGDAFLVPSPYYPGFDRDMKWRSGVKLVPVPSHSNNDFRITKAALDRTFTETEKSGIKVRAILVTSPSNPVGNTLDTTCLLLLLNFSSEKKLHIICDEVYAGSAFADPAFVSIAELLDSQNYDASRVHIVYGLSKDLGLAGFRVGVLYTWNKQVLSSAAGMTRFCSISSQTQCLLSTLLLDKQFVQDYIAENRRRLGERRKWVASLLEKAGIFCAKSNGGLFVWMDMRRYLVSDDPEGEVILWKKLLYEGRLNLTAGACCHCIEPGWFRLCFSSSSDDTLTVAFERLKSLFL
ncbi:hypothetical protein O6H91_09G111400 [Diphasiastrum complanatum]|uniref:Uncharacterized protein n=2 Tax=Diphasiastrum complanatum TaxID=34168 RepID=A0ACC2CTL0_DIPCM|nr:hypothetical protein O6H91_09G111400 [Diphasiastrum complanatum]KAJ7545228.1 hypothetical protein O6H91_09G111400 [Diphasiastrum complanatum]